MLNDHDWRAIQFVLLTLGKDRGYALKNAALNAGDTTTMTMITQVTVIPIESGKFYGDDGQLIEHESVTGDVIDETKKLN